MEGELEGTISAVSGHDALLRSLMEKIDVHKQQIELAETEGDKDHFRYGLEELEDEHLTLIEQMTESGEDAETEAHLLEQLFDCRQMREEFEAILKKHDGHASRVVGNVMRDYGVDEQIYHNGSIIGNHCMKFGEKGKDIVSGVNKEMKNVINTPRHVQYLDDFSEALNNIMDPLYKVLRVMKSVKKQSPTAIKQFKEDTIELNKAIHKLVTDEPVPLV